VGLFAKKKDLIQRKKAWQWLAVPLVLVLLSDFMLQDSAFTRYLRNAVELAFGFKVRRQLHREPHLSPRLKIIAYDDLAADALGMPELPDARLLQVIEGVQRAKPALILIDRTFVFGIPDEKARQGFKDLQHSEIPVAVGAYVSPVALGNRPHIVLSRPELQLNGDLSWLKVKTGVPYGPHPMVIEGFQKIGHLGYSDAGFFEPLVRFAPDKALPHLSLFAAHPVVLQDDGLWIKGERVPLTDGRTLVNVLSLSQLKGHVFSMRSVFQRLDSGGTLNDAINPDDIVLITVSSVTGQSGDLHDTPLGRMRSSHLLAAEINSVITGQWIRSISRLDVAVVVAVELAMFLGLIVNSIHFVIGLFGVLMLMIGGGLFAFSYLSLDVPWLFPSLILTAVAVVQHFRSVFKSQLKMSVLRQALHRLVADDKLELLAKSPGKISLAPQEQHVSILFFDLVGFSLLSEKRSPPQLFVQLKEILQLICETVHEYGGMIDKIQGDGALCTFGFSLETGSVSMDHADRAVECAIAIQKRVFDRNIRANEGVDMFPVRIGVHSSSTFMGDLGASGNIDITVVGPGVNFAKRLEEACEPYRIMISAATRDILRTCREQVLPMTTRRDVSVKHHSELYEAYEINAFSDRPDELNNALRQYWSSQGLHRSEERYLLDKGKLFPVHFPMGAAYIGDFSRSGMRLDATFYVSSGVQTMLSFRPDDCPIFAELAEARLTQVQVLVKWGRILPEGRYALGVQFVGMPEGQRQALVDLLRMLSQTDAQQSAS
jgi:class 3 adenylate cyclase